MLINPNWEDAKMRYQKVNVLVGKKDGPIIEARTLLVKPAGETGAPNGERILEFLGLTWEQVFSVRWEGEIINLD